MDNEMTAAITAAQQRDANGDFIGAPARVRHTDARERAAIEAGGAQLLGHPDTFVGFDHDRGPWSIELTR